MKKDPVLDALQKASKGLQFTSETEAGFESFLWEGGDKLTKQRLKRGDVTSSKAFCAPGGLPRPWARRPKSLHRSRLARSDGFDYV